MKMIDYYKKAWKVTGTLEKYQYFRLVSIAWVLLLAFAILNSIFIGFAGMSLGGIIENIIELIIIVLIICILAYADIRFFPWAKVNLNPHKNMSLVEDMKDGARQEYEDTLNEGPRQYSTYDISSETKMEDVPEDVPTDVPYSVRQQLKAKYGSNYDIYRNNGNSNAVPADVFDQTRGDIKRKYGDQYDVYAKRPTVQRPRTTYFFTKRYYEENYLEFKLRLKTNQIAGALEVLFVRMIMFPVFNFMFNFMIFWPLAFLIGPYKMRSDVEATFGQVRK